MKINIFCINIILCSLLGYSNAFSSALEDPDVDPSKVYSLTIDGVVHKIVADSESKILIDGKPRKVNLQSPAISVFEKGGVKFQYNSSWRFDYKPIDSKSNMWFLIGDHAVLTVMHYVPAGNVDVVISKMKEGYEGEGIDYTLSKADLFHHGKVVDGVKLTAHTKTGYEEHSFFHFAGDESQAVIMLFDSPKNMESNTEEFIRMKRLLENTLYLNL